MKKIEWSTGIITALIISLFSYAALSKLLTFEEFKNELGKSPLLSDFPQLVAGFIIISEVLLVIVLLNRKFRIYGLYGSLFLMILFTSYLIITINFSYYVPCSCGGILAELSWNQHIFFNSIFIILSILGIYLSSSTSNLNNANSKILANQGKAENL
ncbi:MauE/DoxX family redox-associated membrane protein [Solitalea lacus]|uniref:MauE/DoxX family redox-associated membrane protein n=1 Tax=Solitalea lacus TaxID=2911172 RepID=UPI001EDA4A6F|nr:MauE/DoxX family redox-associated membrane protein [Solitalea lacus]UKJ09217.1 hypothetical protein L2B55_08680 [Solitalea lacus]